MRQLTRAAAAVAVSLCVGTGAALADGLDELTEEIVARTYNSEMIDPAQPIEASIYRDWKSPSEPPWTIGYASSYAGNTWRAAVMDRLIQSILPKWQELGLVDDVFVTQSNLNDSVQIQQMRQLVDQGVDAIIVCCSNPTALNATVKYAYERGVPTFSFTGYLTSPYAVNSSVNYQLAGFEIGEWMAQEVGGEGNILVVEGIPGTSGSDSQHRGVLLGLEAYPDINIVGEIAGMWTDQVAQGEVQKWLATNPGQLDGIVVQSAAEMGVLRALQQSGREMAPVAIGGELGALCYWRKNPDYISTTFQVWPPGDDFELIWNIMMRTLQGQGPRIQSILVDPFEFTYADLEGVLDANCDENSQLWLEVGPAAWGAEDYLDQFFLRPADPTQYQP